MPFMVIEAVMRRQYACRRNDHKQSLASKRDSVRPRGQGRRQQAPARK
jgi:hypothetical protein